MDKMTIEMLRAQYNLAIARVDKRLKLPIKRYVEALDKQSVELEKRMATAEKRIDGMFEAIERAGKLP